MMRRCPPAEAISEGVILLLYRLPPPEYPTSEEGETSKMSGLTVPPAEWAPPTDPTLVDALRLAEPPPVVSYVDMVDAVSAGARLDDQWPEPPAPPRGGLGVEAGWAPVLGRPPLGPEGSPGSSDPPRENAPNLSTSDGAAASTVPPLLQDAMVG